MEPCFYRTGVLSKTFNNNTVGLRNLKKNTHIFSFYNFV